MALEGAWPPPKWTTNRGALEKVFGLNRSSHFLRHHRGLLHQLWETQITRAIRATLLESPERTVERCQALLIALDGPTAPRIGRIESISADSADRIDLAMHCRTIDGDRLCVIVEAKLHSELSDTQLRKYLLGLKRDYPRPEQRRLWVVAPTMMTRTSAVLQRRENVEWRFKSWRRLLIEWQRALPDHPGSDVLSLMSEVWKRVGGR